MPPEEAGGRRLAVFGGSFDPFHLGHLAVAQDVFEVLELDDLVFVPAGRAPHKTGEDPAPAHLRLAMVREGVGDDPRFRVSDMEIVRPGISYTVDTLRTLRAEDPARTLFLLMGADQFAAFHRWREPETIGRLARLVAMAREGEEPVENPEIGVTPLVVPVTRLDISSTRVRARVREGRSIRYLVPEGVRRIVVEEGLYRSTRDDPGADTAPVP